MSQPTQNIDDSKLPKTTKTMELPTVCPKCKNTSSITVENSGGGRLSQYPNHHHCCVLRTSPIDPYHLAKVTNILRFVLDSGRLPAVTFRPKVLCSQDQSQWSAALIFSMVQEMRLYTVSTDSTVSFAVGWLFTRIWNATVSSDPPVLCLTPPVLDPLGRMAKPDGRSAIFVESPPPITSCIAGKSTGAYTTIAPDLSMHVSCRIKMLFRWVFLCCQT